MPQEPKNALFKEEFKPCPISPDEDVVASNSPSPLNTQRTDRFRIILNIPKCVEGIYGNMEDADIITFAATTVTTPKVSVPALSIKYSGKSVRMSSFAREQYDDITVVYKIDSGLKNYYILYKWIDFLSSEKDNAYGGKDGKWGEYATTLTVQALDQFRNDVIVGEWIYEKVFITELDAIEWSFAKNGEEINSNFKFTFSDFTFKLYI